MSQATSQNASQETVFDVDVEKLARVYAKAGLNAAGDHKAQQSFVDELMGVVNEVLIKFPSLERLFGSALISQDEKLGVIDRVFGKQLSEQALNFLKVIAKHDRLGVLKPIVKNAAAIWQTRLNQIAVRLELAHPIDPALQKEMIDLIAKRLEQEPIVTVEINPDLIGGFVVRAGDRVLDASVRTNLERARHAMVEKAIAVIEQRPEKYLQGTAS